MLLAVLTAMVLSRPQQALPLTRGQRIGIGLGAFCGAMPAPSCRFSCLIGPACSAARPGFPTARRSCSGWSAAMPESSWPSGRLEVRVKTGDTFAVPVAAAIAIGRLGCYCAGCLLRHTDRVAVGC